MSTAVSYHSAYNSSDAPDILGVKICPLKTKVAGPAATLPEDQEDVVDEALAQFRANIMFKNYKVEGTADKSIIYCTVFISKCLEVINKKPEEGEARKQIQSLLSSADQSPLDGGFFMGSQVEKGNMGEAEKLKGYFKQLKTETANRLLNILFSPDWGTMDLKYWLMFSKLTFLKMKF